MCRVRSDRRRIRDWEIPGTLNRAKSRHSLLKTEFSPKTFHRPTYAFRSYEERAAHLGKIKKASQGLFSVVDRDLAILNGGENGYYPFNGSDPFKKIRVVISVEYSIE